MKILLIGGTGNLSRDCTTLALERGHEVFHLNRGKSSGDSLPGVRTLTADIRNPVQARAAIRAFAARKEWSFDAVVDFIAFRPEEALSDFKLFSGLCRQFVFISSASVYTKPAQTGLINESSPVGNIHWSYAADKLACEAALREHVAEESRKLDKLGITGITGNTGITGEIGHTDDIGHADAGSVPVLTIVRPSHTYSSRWIPSPFISSDFTLAKRILEGKPLVVPGDGTMMWTLTHTRDFAVGLLGLLGNEGAYGRTVQIMSDEAPDWNEIHLELAQALGEAMRTEPGLASLPLVEARLVHIPVDFIASVDPGSGAKLLGDKGYTSVFDCSLLRSLVPDFSSKVRYAQGIRESVSWFLADPSRQKTNQVIDSTMDRILAAWAARPTGTDRDDRVAHAENRENGR